MACLNTPQSRPKLNITNPLILHYSFFDILIHIIKYETFQDIIFTFTAQLHTFKSN